MRTVRARLLAVVSAAALLAAPLASADLAGAESKPKRAKAITVMSRNIYLGADTNRPVAAAQQALASCQDPETCPQEVLFALAGATHQTRQIVDQTNFPARATLLADEIARTQPDLIGLQEVALWRSGPIELAEENILRPNATQVDYDFLKLLLKALRAEGVRYKIAEEGLRADVEAPSFSESPFEEGAQDVRMTMRDVILVRADSAFEVTGTGDEIYDQNLVVDLSGKQMSFDRGYNWVNVRSGDKRLRFVNSHFEAFSSDIAHAQAQQLLAEAVAPKRTTIFVCDCNSDPLNDNVKEEIGDTLPHKAPYELIVGEGGFTDQWLELASGGPGWTSGLSETVDDETAAGFDHRIDMIFARTPDGTPLRVRGGEVTGDELADRDPVTGLWPSDHAGVVLRLRGY